jgi:hypothetical protein
VILPSRAFVAASEMALSMPAMPSVVAVPDHGHHEALLRRDRDADVVEVVLHQRVALDLRVDRRHLPKRMDDRLHEEGHEPQLEAVLLDELLLVLRAERHDGGHVDLVERRQQGRSPAARRPAARRFSGAGA